MLSGGYVSHFPSIKATAFLSTLSLSQVLADPAPTAEDTKHDFDAYVLQEEKKELDVFISADLLIWQANESGLTYAFTMKGIDTAAFDLGEGPASSPKFRWEPGARITLGYHTPHDKWDTSLGWTWFYDQASGHTSASAAGSVLFPSFIHPAQALLHHATEGVTAHNGSGHWKLNLNLVDWELGRVIHTSKKFSIRPFMGLRTAWVFQRYQIEYTDVDTLSGQDLFDEYETDMHNNFWGLGVRAGFTTHWSIKNHFTLYANLALSILYGFFSLTDTEEGDEAVLLKTTDSFRSSRAISDLQLGLGWNKMFCNNKLRLSLLACWEHHMFFSQNQFLRFTDGFMPGQVIQNQGDLAIQGWSLSAKIGF